MDLLARPAGNSSAPVIKFKPYVETEAGYNSNPDNLVDVDSSSFVKVEGGFKLSSETTNEYYGLAVKGRIIDYVDFEPDIQKRTDFRAALDTSFNISSSETLKVGSFFLRDFISLARVDTVHSYSEYTFQGADYRVRLQGRSHIEHNFDNDVRGATESFVDFSSSRSKAFDYLRTDGQVSLLGFTKSVIQPFVILDAGLIDYYNQEC